jgi:hypothetical protein
MQIEIEYDGHFPNLCRGTLRVILDGIRYDFGSHALISGGWVLYNSDTSDIDITRGAWEIRVWPDSFPEDKTIRMLVLDEVNSKIEHGCCGGCS